MFRLIAALAILAALVSAVWSMADYATKAEASRILAAKATPFSQERPGRTMLVLGDSFARGAGAATPEESLPALVAASVGAGTVENYAEDEATLDMLPSQGANAKRSRYDYLFIHIGATDIARFNDKGAAARALAGALDVLPPATHTYLFTAGDLGKTQHFPFFLSLLYSAGSAGYRDEFTRLAASRSIVFVDLSEDPLLDPFVQEPGEYFAKDGLHPSSKGYAEWHRRFRAAAGL